MQNRLMGEIDLFRLNWIERFLEWDFISTGLSDLAVESIGSETVEGLTAELGRDNQYGIMALLRGRIEQDVFK